MNNKTAIIIVHFKGEDDTINCISSFYDNLNNQQIPIVIANCSSELFEKKIKNRFPRVHVIHNTQNIGVSAANNQGLKLALELGCNFFILLNNDTIVQPALFTKLTQFLISDKNTGVVSPKIYFAKGYEFHKDKYNTSQLGKVFWYAGGLIDWDNVYAHHKGVDDVDLGQYDKSTNTEFATGCCMAIKKTVIDKIGFLDENYFLYYEDVDYSIRAKNSGFGVKYFPGVHVWHKNASASGIPGSSIHRYYQTRNRLYFAFRYANLRTKKSIFLESVKQIIHGGIEKKAVVDYYTGHMQKGRL
jgi:GT2 family glycosyltransferase